MFGKKKYAAQDAFDFTVLAVSSLYIKATNEGNDPQAAVEQLLDPTILDCARDDLWREQVTIAAAHTLDFLEEALKKLALGGNSVRYSEKNLETMAYVLCRISREHSPDGTPRKRKGSLFTASHPDPSDRVRAYKKNLNTYLGLAIVHRWGGMSLR